MIHEGSREEEGGGGGGGGPHGIYNFFEIQGDFGGTVVTCYQNGPWAPLEIIVPWPLMSNFIEISASSQYARARGDNGGK